MKSITNIKLLVTEYNQFFRKMNMYAICNFICIGCKGCCNGWGDYFSWSFKDMISCNAFLLIVWCHVFLYRPLVIDATIFVAAYKPPKIQLPEMTHRKLLDINLEKEEKKFNKLNLLYRYRLMQELDLHIETYPLQMVPKQVSIIF